MNGVKYTMIQFLLIHIDLLLHIKIDCYIKSNQFDYCFLARLNNVIRASALPPAYTLVESAAAANVKVFRTSLFPNPMMDLVHVWYGDSY